MISEYFDYAEKFFVQLGKECKELGQFFGEDDTTRVVGRFRGNHGGSALFRPIGLEVFALVVSRMTSDMELSEAIALAAKLPRGLHQEPYPHLMWNPHNNTIVGGHKVTLREILLYMVGMNGRRFPASELLARYRRASGSGSAILPKKIV